MKNLDRAATALALVYAADRLLKLAAVAHFFGRAAPSAPWTESRERQAGDSFGPPGPQPWPSVSLVQPITRGTVDLSRVLESRARLAYAAKVDHILVCDAGDESSCARCDAWMAGHPELDTTLVRVVSGPAQIASKVAKLQAAIPHAHGDVLCFLDDDVLLRPDALTLLMPYLFERGSVTQGAKTRSGELAGVSPARRSRVSVHDAGGAGYATQEPENVDLDAQHGIGCAARGTQQRAVGAVFGLACYVDWHNTWSGLMSAFVNANALLSYIPLTYLTEPFTLTGHCYALRRELFIAVGGFDGMDAARVDDDHELARRVSAAGLRSRQTPLVYDVENSLASLHAYRAQMKRWFLFPRAAMLPGLPPAQQALAFGASATGLVPPLLALLAILFRRGAIIRALAATLALGLAVYVVCERLYLGRRTPLHRLPLVWLSALVAPLEILAALFGGDDFEWRGRRLRMQRGGRAAERT